MPLPKRAAFLAGVRAELPIILGVLPFGLIYGAVASAAGLPASLAQAMSAVVFAGSAQFIAAQLIAAGTPAIVLLTTTLIVNLRHLLYSASLSPYVQHLPRHWKWFLAYLLTDEAYAVVIMNYRQGGETRATGHWFYLGAGLALWTSWQVSTAFGIFLGTAVPASWSLDFALAVTFIGILVPTLRDRPHVAAALTAGITAVVAAALPYKLGLVAAALIGIATGLIVERHMSAPHRQPVN